MYVCADMLSFIAVRFWRHSCVFPSRRSFVPMHITVVAVCVWLSRYFRRSVVLYIPVAAFIFLFGMSFFSAGIRYLPFESQITSNISFSVSFCFVSIFLFVVLELRSTSKASIVFLKWLISIWRFVFISRSCLLSVFIVFILLFALLSCFCSLSIDCLLTFIFVVVVSCVCSSVCFSRGLRLLCTSESLWLSLSDSYMLILDLLSVGSLRFPLDSCPDIIASVGVS